MTRNIHSQINIIAIIFVLINIIIVVVLVDIIVIVAMATLRPHPPTPTPTPTPTPSHTQLSALKASEAVHQSQGARYLLITPKSSRALFPPANLELGGVERGSWPISGCRNIYRQVPPPTLKSLRTEGSAPPACPVLGGMRKWLVDVGPT